MLHVCLEGNENQKAIKIQTDTLDHRLPAIPLSNEKCSLIEQNQHKTKWKQKEGQRNSPEYRFPCFLWLADGEGTGINSQRLGHKLPSLKQITSTMLNKRSSERHHTNCVCSLGRARHPDAEGLVEEGELVGPEKLSVRVDALVKTVDPLQFDRLHCIVAGN